MYKIETHLHTCHSSPCGKVDADTICRLYAEAGYAGIAVTDHFFRYTCSPHAWDVPYDRFFGVFLEGYRQMCKAAVPYGLKIYKGAEVRFDGSVNDYLLYGFPDDLLQDPDTVFSMGLERFSKLSRDAGALLVQAHPHRAKCTAADPCLVDGYEVRNRNNDNDLTQALAAQHPGLVQLCGSDFHRPEHACWGGIQSDTLPEDDAALLRLLRSGAYHLL